MNTPPAAAQSVHEKITAFFSCYPTATYNKGQVLVHAHDPITHVYYLVSGTIRQYDITPTGETIILNIFKPGAFFPMSHAITAMPHRYFLESASAVVFHPAPANDAVKFIQDNPDVMFSLLSRVYIGIEGVLQRMSHLMAGSSSTRLLFELYNAALRFGEQRPDGSYALKITQSELARRTGLARETINRECTKLKTDGLIQTEGALTIVPALSKIEQALGIAQNP